VSRRALREIGADVVPSPAPQQDRSRERDGCPPPRSTPTRSCSPPIRQDRRAAETIIAFFEAAMVEDQLVLPYAKQGLLNDV
jgi:GTP-binding protein HflX